TPSPSVMGCMRSSSLQPPLLRGARGYDLLSALLREPGPASEAVRFVSDRRREALVRAGLDVPTVGPDLAGGKILATDFETDLCGAAVTPSAGFFDFDDIPSWDTWFQHTLGGRTKGGVVYCWVPPDLVPWAEGGLEVIPIHFMRWVNLTEVVSNREHP